MKGLAEDAEFKGSIAALSPVKTPARLKSTLGANEVIIHSFK